MREQRAHAGDNVLLLRGNYFGHGMIRMVSLIVAEPPKFISAHDRKRLSIRIIATAIVQIAKKPPIAPAAPTVTLPPNALNFAEKFAPGAPA